MRCFLLTIATIALAAGQANAQILFSDDFDDGGAAARWSAPVVGLEDPAIGPDSSVDYAFDYSAVLNANGPNFGGPVPPAPNSAGTTIGIYMTANNTDNCPSDPLCTDSDEGESVGIVSLFNLPTDGTPYKVTADLYNYWNNGGGSTEYSAFGVNHDGSNAAPLRFDLNGGSGIAWQADTDGDTFSDILRYNSAGFGGDPSDTDQFVADYQTSFSPGDVPGTSIGEPVPGGIFSRWVELEIVVAGGIAAFSINDVLIDSIPNPFNGGGVLLGHSDAFNSVNLPIAAVGGFTNGSIWDNVVVMVIPEPASAMLLTLGLAALTRRRR